MASRDILPLSVLILKAIAKKPGLYTTATAIQRLLRFPKLNDYDIVQDLLNSITEAGRLTDDVFPIELISPDRRNIAMNNTKLSAKYFRNLVDRCSQLEEIDVSGSFQVDDDTAKYIIEKLVNLKSLKLKNCRKLTASTLQYIVTSKRFLLELDIGGNFNIDIKGIDDFIVSYPFIDQIENIQLSGLVIRDSTMSVLIKKCKNLKKLGIAYADISDQSLIRLIQSVGPKLVYLNISWLSTTSAPAHNQIEASKLIPILTAHCGQLEELDVCGIKSLTVNDIVLFLETIYQTTLSESSSRHPLRILHAKFIATNKVQLETALIYSYPMIKFDL